ncbi:MAG: 23S rRNA (pseudouridine(1915)-N(3))-methyltransferase RlmH [Eubacteriales bacterium]|nr:23S rRNA (pseudouridine(1915)-N(3))-methyltransferase RlmH [Eubacteriales bacterium]
MHVNIVAVGKVKEKFMQDAIDEYKKRLSRFCKLNIIEIKDYPDDKSPIEKEAALILPHLKGIIIPLCIEGKELSSEEFAKLILNQSEITFVIGGSNGLDNTIKSKGTPLSFSPMTFPHQLMRVILTEQIYRAFKINNQESYHK